MNQETFARHGEARWQEFAAQLGRLEKQRGSGDPTFPRLYRAICRDLALARQRQFDAQLVDRLNRLALRGHQHLYRPASTSWRRIAHFWTVGFPRAVRRELGVVAVSATLFYSVILALGLFVYTRPELIYSVLDQGQVADFESMYNPESEHHLRPRGPETDTAMFGFYIRNNTGIGFRTFAWGVFLGLGSLVSLIYNAIVFGALSGYLIQIGYSQTFTSFVIGHGALELQAIVLSAAAGFRLGWSLWAPGRYPRADALRMAAQRAVPLLYGCAALFAIAAAIEAYWSASLLIPATVKYAVGAALWLLVALYFGTARQHYGS